MSTLANGYQVKWARTDGHNTEHVTSTVRQQLITLAGVVTGADNHANRLMMGHAIVRLPS